ncbi:enoyl-CoA hydratase-related protein [Advenella kashmirensis]
MELKVTDYNIDEDGVAVVRLNRPGRGNSWTARMNQEYRWIMSTLDSDPEVRVIVVRGAGKQFCVGADFKALDFYAEEERDYVATVQSPDTSMPNPDAPEQFQHDLVWHWGMRKPVIAAINGACAGIAVAIAGFCDLRYAVAGAKLTTVAARIGLPAEYGLGYLLPRLVGMTHAADILLTGRIFTAEEGLHMGFLNGVFSADEFDVEIDKIAKTMARTVSPQAAMTTKRQLYVELMSTDVGACVEDSKQIIGELMHKPDFKEAIAAMAERRDPNFEGLGSLR